MSEHTHDHRSGPPPHCCPCGGHAETTAAGVSRRGFLGGVGGLAALGGAAMTGLSWKSLSAAEPGLPAAGPRKPLSVKPILIYNTPQRRPQTSWRNWGGIETEDQARAEVTRIRRELDKLQTEADFPVEFLPVAAIHNQNELKGAEQADVLLVYAAGGGTGTYEALGKLGKEIVFFVRYKSGPLYLWYEIVHPRYLRRHTDKLAVEGMDFDDVVVDDPGEIVWRLRSLAGLKNTLGTRILAVGGPGGWAQPAGEISKLAREHWKLDIQTITYTELGKLIQEARKDDAAVARSKRRTDEYLALPGTSLECKREFVVNAFLLEEVFRNLMKRADCRAITINACMGTIMPISETTACLPLSTLNDEGYLAFCESDFVVVPSGILLGNITGKPPFFHNPTYPHHGIMTMAHCTAPRKMDGKNYEPVRILTHFESDYGAAPKVQMRKGQRLTLVNPDFAAESWLGMSGEIVDHPFLPICRSQIDVKLPCDEATLADKMRGFHWMTVYGDYLREVGYALKKIPIGWEVLT